MGARELSAENRAKAEALILAKMRAGNFTFQSLWSSVESETGLDVYRLADRLIQRERKAGRIRQLPGRKGWEPVVQP